MYQAILLLNYVHLPAEMGGEVLNSMKSLYTGPIDFDLILLKGADYVH